MAWWRIAEAWAVGKEEFANKYRIYFLACWRITAHYCGYENKNNEIKRLEHPLYNLYEPEEWILINKAVLPWEK